MPPSSEQRHELALALVYAIAALDERFARLKRTPDDADTRARWIAAMGYCSASSKAFLDAE